MGRGRQGGQIHEISVKIRCMPYSKVVAIDGPSGSGKSSLAKLLSRHLNVLHVNTGAMYRALGLRAEELGVALEKEGEVEDFLSTIRPDYAPSEGIVMAIDGKDYTPLLDTPEASVLACTIAQIPSIRRFLVRYQRTLAGYRVCVMEGRDIGTVVFPDAFAKFFLTASLDTRVQRRWAQLHSKGEEVSKERVREEERERDRADTERAHSPLRLAKDSIRVETDSLSLDEVLQELIRRTRRRAEEVGIPL